MRSRDVCEGGVKGGEGKGTCGVDLGTDESVNAQYQFILSFHVVRYQQKSLVMY